ncbi:DUF2092 domain-containing protein [Echinicola vietnamensis]|uniref:Putative periplasmic protein n=1 Tax=Echinicola vietnamensis (strain DSM 17526 / LMG 23754 / KMM 6221) TaxID=926556 RepID=L0G3B1_ECHVK|nr:DUF2092 domain-containing protein [Echinicola vietnamensis]AGA79481.1 putative periplasmic protein [Echinicola vietnamensis DSM 17526]
MRKLLLVICLTLPLSSYAQERKIDSVAVFILDHMSAVIGDMKSCSYNLSTSNDIPAAEISYSKEYTENEVFMQGPDKMLVHQKGQHGHRGFFYNGEFFTHYSYSENNYTTVHAPDDIVSMIDSINHQFGVEFPAADFFYPTFTDDLLTHFDTLLYLGTKYVNGKDCFHIAASNENQDVQIWIANDAMNLPVKFVIVNKQKSQAPQYEASFSSWKVNPDLPPTIFEFVPPPGARLIAILPKPH